MKLFVVRHGESLGNLHLDQDMPDSPLTRFGNVQAQTAALLLCKQSITKIVSSPLVRAMETAKPLSELLSVPVEVWMDLYEYREGPSFHGRSRTELQRIVQNTLLPEEISESGWRCPGEENHDLVQKRAKSVIQRIRSFSEDNLVLFSHGMLINFLIRELLHIADISRVQFAQSNTGINAFQLVGDQVEVLAINQTEHLRLLDAK